MLGILDADRVLNPQHLRVLAADEQRRPATMTVYTGTLLVKPRGNPGGVVTKIDLWAPVLGLVRIGPAPNPQLPHPPNTPQAKALFLFDDPTTFRGAVASASVAAADIGGDDEDDTSIVAVDEAQTNLHQVTLFPGFNTGGQTTTGYAVLLKATLVAKVAVLLRVAYQVTVLSFEDLAMVEGPDWNGKVKVFDPDPRVARTIAH